MKKFLFIFSFIFILSACDKTSSTEVDIIPDPDQTDLVSEDDSLNQTDEGETDDSGQDSASDLDDSDEDNKTENGSDDRSDDSSHDSDLEDDDHSDDSLERVSLEGKIEVDEPRKNAKVSSPLTIKGEVLGNWFFEGSFPVRLLDEKGNELAKSTATSSEDWMTEEMIPFEAKLEFEVGLVTSGTLVLEKDNPSGLPENAGKVEVPVKF